MNYIFKTADIQRMIEHWLATPPNGYIGVTYGRNPREILQKPLEDDTADTFLRWMREDIPILKQLSDDDLAVVSETVDFETKNIYLKIGQILLPLQTVIGNTVVGG